MRNNFDLSHINPKQKLFFESRAKYTAYGGARGGGKTWGVRFKSIMLAFRYNGIKILILRRTYPELERSYVREMRPLLSGLATYHAQDKYFAFPNGSVIEFGYCQSESDVLQYQGQEFDVIFIDEATQFTEYQFQTLTACVRGANNFPHRMYLTCNPGGVGHEWVKRLFITRKYTASERPEDYVFIQALVYDNTVLQEKDPEYVRQLENLPEGGLREMWLNGNWDIFAGQYFSEFDRSIHVCEPFTIPEHWNRYRAMDYGLDMAAFLWIAVDEDGHKYVYREYAEEDKSIPECCKAVKDLSGNETYIYTAAPDDMWGRTADNGRRKADLFSENGIDLLKVSRDREAGWLAIKNALAVKDGTSDLKIFSNCAGLIECLPALQRSPKKPTDCMTEPHEITHLPDALRYFCLFYQIPTKPIEQEKTYAERMREQTFKRLKKNKNKARNLW